MTVSELRKPLHHDRGSFLKGGAAPHANPEVPKCGLNGVTWTGPEVGSVARRHYIVSKFRYSPRCRGPRMTVSELRKPLHHDRGSFLKGGAAPHANPEVPKGCDDFGVRVIWQFSPTS
jgi:hypothetical protein